MKDTEYIIFKYVDTDCSVIQISNTKNLFKYFNSLFEKSQNVEFKTIKELVDWIDTTYCEGDSLTSWNLLRYENSELIPLSNNIEVI